MLASRRQGPLPFAPSCTASVEWLVCLDCSIGSMSVWRVMPSAPPGPAGDASAWEEWDARRSLFDNHVSPDLEANLDYMFKNFGFYLPDAGYLSDPEGLVKYLVCRRLLPPLPPPCPSLPGPARPAAAAATNVVLPLLLSGALLIEFLSSCYSEPSRCCYTPSHPRPLIFRHSMTG